jgi:hypothetical protein
VKRSFCEVGGIRSDGREAESRQGERREIRGQRSRRMEREDKYAASYSVFVLANRLPFEWEALVVSLSVMEGKSVESCR